MPDESPTTPPAHLSPAETLIAARPTPARPFQPGETLNQRYRIVTHLGRGGMGDVYRADDLVLGLPVALKFLPPADAIDPALLDRLKSEVRIARQVSHANVCRVYDIGEADGRQFISMEYVDGEDLSSLLRRIGRLPPDKAVQIARQLCFGLAAAHDQGVVHRDLKPANIMLDGRGNARIMDFGIAGLAEPLAAGHDAGAGTPAYMAPEQHDGKAATRRSDIYALGVVLYELFTGRHPRDTAAPGTRDPARPTDLVRELEPDVERAILRCLEADPSRRPASALAVAGALPGGDPLAAALAAGETPSPQLVAQSGEAGVLAPRAVILLAVTVLVALGAALAARAQFSLFRKTPLPHSAEVLAARVQEHLRSIGYAGPAPYSAYGFSLRTALLRSIASTDTSRDRWDTLAAANQAPVSFWYRASPRPLRTLAWSNPRVTYDDPPPRMDGAVQVVADAQGHLRSLTRYPDADWSQSPAEVFDPAVLFRAAGLEIAAFEPVASERTPPVACDTRLAWKGELPGSPATPVRLEAATERGRLVSFITVYPWSSVGTPGGGGTEARVLEGAQLAGELLQMAMITTCIVLARRNLRLGRADRRGAFRLAMCGMACLMLSSWLYGTGAGLFAALFGNTLVRAVFFAVVWWMLYTALEPAMRRTRPHAIVGWSRLLDGRLKDPLVGRDILVGALGGAVVLAAAPLEAMVAKLLGSPPPTPIALDLGALTGVRAGLATVVLSLYTGLIVALTLSLLLVMFRMAIRVEALGVGLLIVLVFVSNFLENIRFTPGAAAGAVLVSVVLVAVLKRFGVLATASLAFTAIAFLRTPAVLDTSAWYATPTLFSAAAVLALVGWGFYAAMGGRPLVNAAALDG